MAGTLRHPNTTPNDGCTRGNRTPISRFWKRRWIYWFWAHCWNPHARGGGGHCTANMESLQAVRQSLQSGRKSLHRLWGLCAQSLRTWAVSCPHSLAGRVCLTMGAMSGIRGSAAPCHVSPFGTTCPTSRSSLRPQLHGHVIGCRWLQAPRRQRRPDWGRLPISLRITLIPKYGKWPKTQPTDPFLTLPVHGASFRMRLGLPDPAAPAGKLPGTFQGTCPQPPCRQQGMSFHTPE